MDFGVWTWSGMAESFKLLVVHTPHTKLHKADHPYPLPPLPGRALAVPVTSGGSSYLHEIIMPSDEDTTRSQLNLTFALRNFGLKYLPKKAPLTEQGAESLWTNSSGTWPCNIAKIFSKTSDPTCICSEGWNEIKLSYRYINMYEKWRIRPATVESKQLTFQGRPPFFGSNFGSKTKFKASSISHK